MKKSLLAALFVVGAIVISGCGAQSSEANSAAIDASVNASNGSSPTPSVSNDPVL